MKKILKIIITTILLLEARLVLKKYKPKIIAITGSVGKTSTKDAIYTVLNRSFYVRRSEKSFNSTIGIALTILDCDTGWNNPFTWIKNIFSGISLIIFRNQYPRWLILEIGADKPGYIKKITSWMKPDVVVVTRFGEVPAHMEIFTSPEEIIKEKSYLVKALKQDGLLVLNSDDKAVLKMKELSKSKTKTYGFLDGADMQATNVDIAYEQDLPAGLTFKLEHLGRIMPVRLEKLLGRHHIFAALAALTVAENLEINLVDALDHVGDYEPPPGRLRLLHGIKGCIIIDDTYNSSPVALNSAIETLNEIKAKGKKIAILGDMLELGKYTKKEHEKAGEKLGKFCDLLLLVGPRSDYISEGAQSVGMNVKNIIFFNDAQKAGKFIESQLLEGDVVLIKGSQGMRMEQAVKEIMAHPDMAEELLVRQEKEWEER